MSDSPYLGANTLSWSLTLSYCHPFILDNDKFYVWLHFMMFTQPNHNDEWFCTQMKSCKIKQISFKTVPDAYLNIIIIFLCKQ